MLVVTVRASISRTVIASRGSITLMGQVGEPRIRANYPLKSNRSTQVRVDRNSQERGDNVSDLKDKHRTVCKEIEHLGLQITAHANHLKCYPDSDGDSLGMGKCVYEITQKLVTLTKLKKGMNHQI